MAGGPYNSAPSAGAEGIDATIATTTQTAAARVHLAIAAMFAVLGLTRLDATSLSR
jgi:hypothetical protein